MWEIPSELARLRSEGLFRKPLPLSLQSPTQGFLNQQPVQIFCSNDYLGLRCHPRVLEGGRQALEAHGAGSGGARQLAGDLPVHRELETELAAFLGTERTLLFSSGDLANVGALPALTGKGDILFSDSRNHASLIDGCRLSRARTVIFEHRDLADLEKKILRFPGRRRLVVTESVFSMDGTVAPLAGLARLCGEHQVEMYVDEAHGLGVVGPGGRGLSPEVSRQIAFRMGTLSKSLGSAGAFLAGSAENLDYLRNRARTYLFDTSLTPAAAGAGLAALRVLREEPQRVTRLGERSLRLRQSLKDWLPAEQSESTPILPLMVGQADRALEIADRLLEEGFLLPAIRPPTVAAGTSRLRLSLSLENSEDMVNRLVRALESIRKDLGAPVFVPSRVIESR